MFKIFYCIGIWLYTFLIYIFSIANKKAKLWVQGRKNIWKIITESDASNTDNIWFHVSSLGEFEQARPLIEKVKLNYPDFKIVLTFFSPSGYEIRKNYALADYIWYMPIDTPSNAKRFVSFVKPKYAFYVKYDFWYFYLKTLYENKVPTYLVSGIFRESQVFFKPWGKGYAKVLRFFTHLFVQNDQSKQLLEKLDVKNVTIAGDTRFDRVIDIAENSVDFPIIESFLTDQISIVAGSTWLQDEIFLSKYLNENINVRLIIAPHEVDEDHILNIIEQFNCTVNRYTKSEGKDLTKYRVLIIDTIGMLSSIYKYGKIAYIGGGFGAGIHNIVEPAVYGMPVVFGPKYKKFKEAVDMLELKAAFTFSNYEELKITLDKLIKSEKLLNESSQSAKKYVYSNKGATSKVLNFVFEKNK